MFDPRIDILDILSAKRWALYPTETREGVFCHISDLEDVIKKGRTKNPFELDDRRHLILPLAKKDYSPEHVFTLYKMQKYPPCYHDFSDTGVFPWELSREEMARSLKGVYPIDSISYDGNLLMMFDKRNPANSEFYKNTLEFDFYNINNVLKCINRYNVVENKEVTMPVSFLTN